MPLLALRCFMLLLNAKLLSLSAISTSCSLASLCVGQAHQHTLLAAVHTKGEHRDSASDHMISMLVNFQQQGSPAETYACYEKAGECRDSPCTYRPRWVCSLYKWARAHHAAQACIASP